MPSLMNKQEMTISSMKAILRSIQMKYDTSIRSNTNIVDSRSDIEFLAKTCIFLLNELNLNPDIVVRF